MKKNTDPISHISICPLSPCFTGLFCLFSLSSCFFSLFQPPSFCVYYNLLTVPRGCFTPIGLIYLSLLLSFFLLFSFFPPFSSFSLSLSLSPCRFLVQQPSPCSTASYGPAHTNTVITTLCSTFNWSCSGRSTQVPFWRIWVIDGFEVIIVKKIFWQNFGRFGPFPVGVMQRSSGGQNFKILQMTFHAYQIAREVIMITKIYSLLCVGYMVREILTKGHPKVKWGQIFNNIRFAWMIYQNIPLSLHIPKIYTFKLSELSLLN